MVMGRESRGGLGSKEENRGEFWITLSRIRVHRLLITLSYRHWRSPCSLSGVKESLQEVWCEARRTCGVEPVGLQDAWCEARRMCGVKHVGSRMCGVTLAGRVV